MTLPFRRGLFACALLAGLAPLSLFAADRPKEIRIDYPKLDPEIRDRMAIACAPDVHSRLAAMTNPAGDGPAVVRFERIERVIVDHHPVEDDKVAQGSHWSLD
jgi:hypothetical protein